MHFLVIRWNIGFLWPYVTMWPWLMSVTTGDKSDYMWQLCHGHLDIMDIWTSWTFGHHGHLNITKEHIWKFFLMNIWNIVGRRFLRKFPSSFSKLTKTWPCAKIYSKCVQTNFQKMYKLKGNGPVEPTCALKGGQNGHKSYLQMFIFILVTIMEEVRHIKLIKATDVGKRIQTDRGPFVPKSNALTCLRLWKREECAFLGWVLVPLF